MRANARRRFPSPPISSSSAAAPPDRQARWRLRSPNEFRTNMRLLTYVLIVGPPQRDGLWRRCLPTPQKTPSWCDNNSIHTCSAIVAGAAQGAGCVSSVGRRRQHRGCGHRRRQFVIIPQHASSTVTAVAGSAAVDAVRLVLAASNDSTAAIQKAKEAFIAAGGPAYHEAKQARGDAACMCR